MVKYSKLSLADQGQDKGNCIKGFSQYGNARERLKKIRVEKKKWNCNVLGDIIVYFENSKNRTAEQLEVIIKFSKVAEYKANIRKPII